VCATREDGKRRAGERERRREEIGRQRWIKLQSRCVSTFQQNTDHIHARHAEALKQRGASIAINLSAPSLLQTIDDALPGWDPHVSL
jgi:hypothetical protein